MKACREVTNVCSKNMKANQKELESKLEHQEVPKEEAMVKIIAVLEDQYGDWHLAIGCH
jgi:hypothetical protein